MNEQRRRSTRKPADGVIQVVDAMTGVTVGRVSNLSVDGMLLLTSGPMRENALFQFSFSISDATGRPVPLEIGVHEQWTEAANAPGQYWSGFRIIDIAPADQKLLAAWVDRSGVG